MIDKTKKIGEVWGMPGVRYEQGGKLYNQDFVEVDQDGKPVKKGAVKPAPVAILDTPPATEEKVDGAQDVPHTEAEETQIDYATLPWQQLKKMVEGSGGVWVNKEEAILFLKGL